MLSLLLPLAPSRLLTTMERDGIIRTSGMMTSGDKPTSRTEQTAVRQ